MLFIVIFAARIIGNLGVYVFTKDRCFRSRYETLSIQTIDDPHDPESRIGPRRIQPENCCIVPQGSTWVKGYMKQTPATGSCCILVQNGCKPGAAFIVGF